MGWHWPGRTARTLLAVTGGVWAGTLCGLRLGWGPAGLAAALALVFAAWSKWRPAVISAFLAAGCVGGWQAAVHEQAVLTAELPSGPVHLIGKAMTDLREGRYQGWFLIAPSHLVVAGAASRWNGPPLLVSADEPVLMGQLVGVEGPVRADPGWVRGRPFAGRVSPSRVQVLAGGEGPLLAAGNAVHRRVLKEIEGVGDRRAAGLLAGLLIGEDSGVLEADRAALRAAGLSHYIAVSGSNVALFLMLWWLALGPIALAPRLRSLAGLTGLAVFAAATRFEPSVLRASLMAGLPMIGRLVGIPLDAWTSLGATVTALLLAVPTLAAAPGFQLSVAATAGILAGAGCTRRIRPRAVGAVLGASVAAQAAVTPLLIWHFGAVPLLGPLANVVAAPLVMASTLVGSVGVTTGVRWLTGLAAHPARILLELARVAEGWPQLDLWAFLISAATALGLAVPRIRPAVALAGGAVVAHLLALAPGPVTAPAAVFLDVGQGDASLLLGTHGSVVLIDGGPEPALLAAKLRHYRVGHIDLLVVSHPHADHFRGLEAVIGRMPVGWLWESGSGHESEEYRQLLATARRAGVHIDQPRAGKVVVLDGMEIEVLGPLRRYAGPNDQSLVLLVDAGGRTIAFSGDVEKVAQRELGPIEADILKVPHQGAATSDARWLVATADDLAVISVGENDYGHPAGWVIEVLEEAGAEVVRTDQHGDVVVSLSP